MKQLGSSVDDAFGEDEKLAGGGRRASKEKKCTPLKEKLHKMWGGRVRACRLQNAPLESLEAPHVHCTLAPFHPLFPPFRLSLHACCRATWSALMS